MVVHKAAFVHKVTLLALTGVTEPGVKASVEVLVQPLTPVPITVTVCVGVSVTTRGLTVGLAGMEVHV